MAAKTGGNFSELFGNFNVPIVGTRVGRSVFKLWLLYATETSDKCRPDGSLGSYAELTFIYLATLRDL